MKIKVRQLHPKQKIPESVLLNTTMSRQYFSKHPRLLLFIIEDGDKTIKLNAIEVGRMFLKTSVEQIDNLEFKHIEAINTLTSRRLSSTDFRRYSGIKYQIESEIIESVNCDLKATLTNLYINSLNKIKELGK